MPKKRSSSKSWLREHFDDQYVKLAQQQGYRSRASFKLIELDDKDRLLRPGIRVLDLGSAPGGWSQVAAQRVGDRGEVIASDILSMDSIAGVHFIQGDFTEDAVFSELLGVIGEKGLDLVMSDMAPNISGMKAVDQPRSIYLVELAVDLATQVLRPGGNFVTKAFQGEGFDEIYRGLKGQFKRVVTRKPAASRPRSPEVYLVATGFRAGA